MVGRRFKAWAAPGTETELALEMGCGTAGLREADEPLYLYAEGTDLFETIHRAFAWLQRKKAFVSGRTAVCRTLPVSGLVQLGCLYREVSEAGILQKAQELRAKQVPVRWFVIDDGWLQTREDQLTSLRPDPAKFPRGFKPLVQDLKRDFSIDWVGVWHALAGFWSGIAPDSEAAAQERGALCRTAGGTLLPSPVGGERFYRDWYDLLRREGIRFVKVDGQSSTANYFENTSRRPSCRRPGPRPGGRRRRHGRRHSPLHGDGHGKPAGPAGLGPCTQQRRFSPPEAGALCRTSAAKRLQCPLPQRALLLRLGYVLDQPSRRPKTRPPAGISGGPVYVSDPVGQNRPRRPETSGLSGRTHSLNGTPSQTLRRLRLFRPHGRTAL